MQKLNILPLALVLTLSFAATPGAAQKMTTLPEPVDASEVQDLQGKEPFSGVDVGFRGQTPSSSADGKDEFLPSSISGTGATLEFPEEGGAADSVKPIYDGESGVTEGDEGKKPGVYESNYSPEEIQAILEKKKEDLLAQGGSQSGSGSFSELGGEGKPGSDREDGKPVDDEKDPEVEIEAPVDDFTTKPEEGFEGAFGEVVEVLDAEVGVLDEEGKLEDDASGARFQAIYEETRAELESGSRRAAAGNGDDIWTPTRSFNPR